MTIVELTKKINKENLLVLETPDGHKTYHDTTVNRKISGNPNIFGVQFNTRLNKYCVFINNQDGKLYSYEVYKEENAACEALYKLLKNSKNSKGMNAYNG